MVVIKKKLNAYFLEKDLARNMRWTFQRASFDEVRVDGVEAWPVSVEEVLVPPFDPVAGALLRAAEKSGWMLGKGCQRRLENQSADVDSDELLNWECLRPRNDDG